MPIEISDVSEIRPGDIYEDSAYHPCLCIGIDGYEIWGISLVDGSYPRMESIGMSGVRKLTLQEAWKWKLNGPDDILDDEINKKWW